MSTATITSKGQVTIPKKVRDNLHIDAGDRIEFIKRDDGRYEIIAATRNIRDLKGRVSVKRQKAVSIEEMNQAIANMGKQV